MIFDDLDRVEDAQKRKNILTDISLIADMLVASNKFKIVNIIVLNNGEPYFSVQKTHPPTNFSTTDKVKNEELTIGKFFDFLYPFGKNKNENIEAMKNWIKNPNNYQGKKWAKYRYDIINVIETEFTADFLKHIVTPLDLRILPNVFNEINILLELYNEHIWKIIFDFDFFLTIATYYSFFKNIDYIKYVQINEKKWVELDFSDFHTEVKGSTGKWESLFNNLYLGEKNREIIFSLFDSLTDESFGSKIGWTLFDVENVINRLNDYFSNYNEISISEIFVFLDREFGGLMNRQSFYTYIPGIISALDKKIKINYEPNIENVIVEYGSKDFYGLYYLFYQSIGLPSQNWSNTRFSISNILNDYSTLEKFKNLKWKYKKIIFNIFITNFDKLIHCRFTNSFVDSDGQEWVQFFEDLRESNYQLSLMENPFFIPDKHIKFYVKYPNIFIDEFDIKNPSSLRFAIYNAKDGEHSLFNFNFSLLTESLDSQDFSALSVNEKARDIIEIFNLPLFTEESYSWFAKNIYYFEIFVSFLVTLVGTKNQEIIIEINKIINLKCLKDSANEYYSIDDDRTSNAPTYFNNMIDKLISVLK
ncbi:hypothetical protein [Mesoplasma lactucae]|uniref:Uncharacterized protein n=1 Tax=Mesoplasma lactucae ATCC 49193 TaxID=81460 RepID=A0A291IR09_9MOLU|nr:hypothetical protein [Mesoplasma lactucae]ATG97166.1 hypothetical protein CP520_00090 [Mesoplasma lactucae ATCC 49193]ATZ20394.1 hypothetical protein MLACT_v1c05730 [Mesoplasma lactucae ATCC 49193]MCL8216565.1 hypothetical protein [Mesoplasma lactucae ATCC 49193]